MENSAPSDGCTGVFAKGNARAGRIPININARPQPNPLRESPDAELLLSASVSLSFSTSELHGSPIYCLLIYAISVLN